MFDGTVSKNAGKWYKCCHFGMQKTPPGSVTSHGIQWSHHPTGNEDAT